MLIGFIPRTPGNRSTIVIPSVGPGNIITYSGLSNPFGNASFWLAITGGTAFSRIVGVLISDSTGFVVWDDNGTTYGMVVEDHASSTANYTVTSMIIDNSGFRAMTTFPIPLGSFNITLDYGPGPAPIIPTTSKFLITGN